VQQRPSRRESAAFWAALVSVALLWIATFAMLLPVGCTSQQRVLPELNPLVVQQLDSIVFLNDPMIGAGSGFVISSERPTPLDQNTPTNKWRTLVMTAGHCLEIGPHMQGHDATGGSLGEAHAHWKCRTADVAILEFWTDAPMRPLKFRPEPVRAGEHVWIEGFPWAQRAAVAQGYVGDPRSQDFGVDPQDPEQTVENAILTVVLFGDPGNSGSAVFDDHGEVVGVLTLGFGAPGGLNGIVVTADPRVHEWVEKILHLDPPYWDLPTPR
jgi:S1-C subfamily serine protease